MSPTGVYDRRGRSNHVQLPVAERLWRHVDRSGGPDACWPWVGYTQKGYGRLRGTDGRKALAHRVAYELSVGPIPDSLHICHTCDNPPCCNPAHLVPGTHTDNMHDMDARGRRRSRGVRGSANHGARLNETRIARIRELVNEGVSKQRIADSFGVSRMTISDIAFQRTWRHVP
jgi:hypothetical protein